MRVVGLCLFLLLTCAPDAGAQPGVRLLSPAGTAMPAYQQWADASLMPTVAETIEVRHEPCPAAPRAAGCTDPAVPVIWLRPRNAPWYQTRETLLHELGHRFDYARPGIRPYFTRLIVGAPDEPWRSASFSLNEQFAEAYMLCSLWRHSPLEYETSVPASMRFGYVPSEDLHRRACRLIRRF